MDLHQLRTEFQEALVSVLEEGTVALVLDMVDLVPRLAHQLALVGQEQSMAAMVETQGPRDQPMEARQIWWSSMVAEVAAAPEEVAVGRMPKV
jgi:hypothetical protein